MLQFYYICRNIEFVNYVMKLKSLSQIKMAACNHTNCDSNIVQSSALTVLWAVFLSLVAAIATTSLRW